MSASVPFLEKAVQTSFYLVASFKFQMLSFILICFLFFYFLANLSFLIYSSLHFFITNE